MPHIETSELQIKILIDMITKLGIDLGIEGSEEKTNSEETADGTDEKSSKKKSDTHLKPRTTIAP